METVSPRLICDMDFSDIFLYHMSIGKTGESVFTPNLRMEESIG